MGDIVDSQNKSFGYDTQKQERDEQQKKYSNNVLISDDKALIADFGLSKQLNEVNSLSSALQGMAAYIEPQVIEKRLSKVHRSTDPKQRPALERVVDDLIRISEINVESEFIINRNMGVETVQNVEVIERPPTNLLNELWLIFKESTNRGNEFQQISKMIKDWCISACNNLGIYYELGIEEKNTKKAFEHYKIAAKEDIPFGQCNLARCFKNGTGTEKIQNSGIKKQQITGKRILTQLIKAKGIDLTSF
ncbi:11685_t:CDS:2 [Gigaspora margarita]|uniref:11685_t:CDS:1 n=1 Tax=Gigaspora margarita TaxID=4874 RepID=A0ABN7UX08_GIGMA|nr:11685_t:CDS:2 [Gigaspora margarita]